MKIKSGVQFAKGTVHASNNYGDFIVTKYVNPKLIEVQFKDTGSRVTATAANLKLGNVKDKNKPTLCGVGALGYGEYKGSDKGEELEAYTLWKNMISVCYKPSVFFTFYADCTVTEDWLNFQNFAKWHEENKKLEGKHKIKLEKGKKVFSPQNCTLVSNFKL